MKQSTSKKSWGLFFLLYWYLLYINHHGTCPGNHIACQCSTLWGAESTFSEIEIWYRSAGSIAWWLDCKVNTLRAEVHVKHLEKTHLMIMEYCKVFLPSLISFLWSLEEMVIHRRTWRSCQERYYRISSQSDSKGFFISQDGIRVTISHDPTQNPTIFRDDETNVAQIFIPTISSEGWILGRTIERLGACGSVESGRFRGWKGANQLSTWTWIFRDEWFCPRLRFREFFALLLVVKDQIHNQDQQEWTAFSKFT